jgi:hypothetical protein
VIYGDCGLNRAKAIERLTNVRKPEIPGYDAFLWDNQRRFYASPVMDTYRRTLNERFKIYVANRPRQVIWLEYVFAPHIKLALRLLHYGNGYVNAFFMGLTTWVLNCIAKLKLMEWAKWLKIPRLINDLTVLGSLLAGAMYNEIKHVLDEDITVRNGRFRFYPTPSAENLQSAFARLMLPEFSIECIAFSDDACFAVICCDGILVGNSDVSSCDGSHGKEHFDLMSSIVDGSDYEGVMRKSLLQHQIPLTMENPNKRWQKIKLYPKYPVLYTGSTATTTINTLANLSIFASFESMYDPSWTMEEAKRAWSFAAEEAGYIVTVAQAYHPEQIQFLKHSPILTTIGTYVPCINLGVILRCIGNCKRRIPGRGTLAQRCESFDHELVLALKHMPRNALIRALDRGGPRSWAAFKYIREELNLTKGSISYGHLEADETSLLRRYDISLGEWDELLDAIVAQNIGDIVRTPASDKILNLDYEYDFKVESPQY